ncbi:ArnT family glycosyltransferase [Paenibacillus alvei]|uniref:ArnT family glycosyltransferase n=1 Tax=Paenibacillus alvei TaxID=44250 RepID=UPI00228077E9|nr:glycosyltransferase family 39 protein [Paenibacillus alvei]
MFFRILRNSKVCLSLILFIGFITRFVYFLKTPFPLSSDKLLEHYPDENVYYMFAELINNKGLWTAFLDERSLWVAPLNSMYISILSGVTSQPILFIRLVNIFISVLFIFIIYKISKKLFNTKVGLLAALFVSVYFPIIEVSPTLLTEPLFMLLLSLFALFILKERETHSTKYLVLSALFLALATLTRSVTLLAPGFIALAFIQKGISKKIILQRMTIFIVSFGLVISPVILKNFIVFNKFTISNGSGAALYLGTRPDTEGDEPPYRGKDYATMEITTPFNHLQSEGDERLRQVAISNIKNNFFDYCYWNVKKVGRLLVGNEYYWFFPFNNALSYYHEFGLLQTVIKIFNMLLALIVSVFGGYYLFVCCIRKQYNNPVILLIMYIVIFSLPFLVIPRYGLPVVCLLSIFAAGYFFSENKVKL